MPGPTEEPRLCSAVAISRWAVAGAALGRPVYVEFRDFPPAVVAELFRKHVAWVGKGAVVSVYADRDLRTLENRTADVRLVLLFEPRLFARTSWLLDINRAGDSDMLPACPALFVVPTRRGLEEGSGPTLVLHGYSPHVTRVNEWIEAGGSLGSRFEVVPPVTVRLDRRLETVLADAARPGGRLGVRERQILMGLWVGAAILGPRGDQLVEDAPVSVGPDEYRAVYGPLKSASIQPADQAFDPITVAMVQRANAYLQIPAADRPGLVMGSDVTGITRRELTDLGNVHGPTVRALLTHLLARGDEGFTAFLLLGLRRHGAGNARWPTDDPSLLAAWLLPWTEKMVRERFVRLCRDGLVTGSRGARNKHWVYLLPEAVGHPASPFASLPSPDVVAGTGLPGPPPPAPTRGQTEVPD